MSHTTAFSRKAVRRLAHLIVMALCLAAIAVAPASAGSPYSYHGAATVVSQVNGNTIVDNGTVLCSIATDSGQGGFCVPFSDIANTGSTLTVVDQASGQNVSYQVCLDNNGNGICGDADTGACADRIWYSHAADPAPVYSNPMSGLPTAHASGCTGPLHFEGLVVFMCTGTHDSHVESATVGSATLGTGPGSAGFTEPGPPVPFCGGQPPAPQKTYVVTSHYTETDSGVLEGVAQVTPLGLLVAHPGVNGAWRLDGTATLLRAGSVPLWAEGSIGPSGGIGAGCGFSSGSGEGVLGPYTLEDIHWPASAGGMLPVTARWERAGSSGELSAAIQAQASPAACATATASEFDVIGAFALL